MAEKKEIVFSKSQIDAIDAADKTLVVSAGAGSGKTTVLTERILRRLIAGTDITEILVVTFLRSAALSLRTHLYDALTEYSVSHPQDAHITRSIYMLPAARISTVDSFCLDIVRDNFNALSLPPALRVIDDCENEIITENCLDRLIDAGLASEDKDFLSLCGNFADYRSFDSFKKLVSGVMSKYRALPFWRETVTSEAESLESDASLAKKNGFFACECGKELKEYVSRNIAAAQKIAHELRSECEIMLSSEKEFAQIDCVCDLIENVTGSLERGCSFDELYSLLYEINIVTKPTFKDSSFNEYYKPAMEQIKEYLTECSAAFSNDESGAVALYCEMAQTVKRFNDFVLKLDDECYAAKKARGALDFADIEQLALRLLGERTETEVKRTALCETIRAGIKEIYIDEYQDINPLQDTLFRLISRPDNRFMVGDVKQSIYRFRNSSAKIFMGYMERFPDLAEAKENARVFLNENYRSEKYILDFVNLVFENLYTEDTVGVSYENEKLRYPQSKDPAPSAPVEVDVFTGDGANAEREAEYVASCIKSLVESGEYGYGDIAVLMRSVTENGVVFRKAFDEAGIPYSSDQKANFLAFPEIRLALAVLRSIDDPLDDISLASALRSPVFRLKAQDLYAVKRYYAYDSLYDCVRSAALSYARHTQGKRVYKADRPRSLFKVRKSVFLSHGRRVGDRPTIHTRKKCHDALLLLASLRRSGVECSGSRMIWLMYQKTRMISLCAAEKGGEKRVANLYALYKFALEYEKTSFRGLSDFLIYLEKAAAGENFKPETEQDDSDFVKILTIHQSKGLEYPVCFVSAAGKSFNKSDLSKRCSISAEGRLSCSLVHGFVTERPLAFKLQLEKEKKNIWHDELYCLYVALTRARSRLYVTGIMKKLPDEQSFYESDSAIKWIYGALKDKNAAFFTLNENPEPKQFEKTKVKESTEKTISADLFRKAAEFSYPLPSGSETPAKAAVSELRKGILEDDEYTRTVSVSEATKIPSFASEKADAASVGTSTHLFMQFADFGLTESEGVKAEIERLADIGMITRDDASRIDLMALETFFRSGLCSLIKASPLVVRERRFNLIEDSSMLSRPAGEKVMIQGVIDCFFKNPDGTFTVVDYKTDRVRREDGEQVLIERHSFQIRYYCRAVERMTGGKVSRALLYSFALGKSVEVPYGS
ncbi:MAG: UvrD-helicase domain-containing protein [Clostridia bacterium]|nr:UvrD-helicase domain-containing protein [Clostridia bacterium]